MNSSGYQSMLGTSDLDTDAINTNTLIVEEDLTVFGKSNITSLRVSGSLVLPTSATIDDVLTCIDISGTSQWKPPALAALAGDCTGFSSSNQVNTLAGGTVPVNTVVTLAGTQTLTNKTLGAFTATGMETLQKDLWFNNQINTKMISLWDGGVATDQTSHNFYGFGVNSLTFRYHVAGSNADHVFFCGNSPTSSSELFRIKGNGSVIAPGLLQTSTLKVTTGASLGSILTSDASGNATWLAPAVVTAVGNLYMSGNLYNAAGTKYLLATTPTSSYLCNSGNLTASGDDNTMCGSTCGYSLTTGFDNTAFGQNSLGAVTTSSFNTAVGANSLSVTTGPSNTAVGWNSGSGLTSGFANTFVGLSARTSLATVSNSCAIGADSTVATSNTIQLGDANITDVNTSGQVNAIVFHASGYKAPVAQGAYIGWNRVFGNGIATWGNQKGFGGGGHEWTDYNIGTGATTVGMTLSPGGNLVTSGQITGTFVNTAVVTTTTGVMLPTTGGTANMLNYYEEYSHSSTFSGPVTTGTYPLKIVRVGTLVTVYMGYGLSATVVTGGLFTWNMTTPFTARFCPPTGVNTIVLGKNNGVLTMINGVVDNAGNLMLSVALSASAWAGAIAVNAFSISWTV